MVFSSIVFLLYFLPFFFLIYYLLPNNFKNIFILIASIFFYSWGAPKFILVILGTTFLDFILVGIMDESSNSFKRKLLLSISVTMNVGLLFYFKYCNFFIDNINGILTIIEFRPLPILNVILPIGISFYTFETLTYVIDVYRREHKPLTNFLNYQVYIILFPKLIAGPIIRYSDIADQIMYRFETFLYSDALRGFHRFCIGLAKKVIIANTLGYYADIAFETHYLDLTISNAWLGMLSYTMQIYFDFSGYSDMALGLGQMMGFNFPENFNNPYTSKSITEFWRRWHMTLGSWMRNYLYIPLGGNRVKTQTKLFFNLWIVFLLSGFWHGASWTFIFWGAYHGVFLILERIGYGKFLIFIGEVPSMIITFFFVNIGWIFFRENNFTQALQYIKALFISNHAAPLEFNYIEFYFVLAIALLFSFFVVYRPFEKIQHHIYYGKLTVKRNILYTIIALVLFIFCISLITASSFNPFIYFRF
jgi:alginate O-acetyltransferase complex protein AlgI